MAHEARDIKPILKPFNSVPATDFPTMSNYGVNDSRSNTPAPTPPPRRSSNDGGMKALRLRRHNRYYLEDGVVFLVRGLRSVN